MTDEETYKKKKEYWIAVHQCIVDEDFVTLLRVAFALKALYKKQPK